MAIIFHEVVTEESLRKLAEKGERFACDKLVIDEFSKNPISNEELKRGLRKLQVNKTIQVKKVHVSKILFSSKVITPWKLSKLESITCIVSGSDLMITKLTKSLFTLSSLTMVNFTTKVTTQHQEMAQMREALLLGPCIRPESFYSAAYLVSAELIIKFERENAFIICYTSTGFTLNDFKMASIHAERYGLKRILYMANFPTLSQWNSYLYQQKS